MLKLAMAMDNPFLILMYFVHVSVFEGMIYMATLAAWIRLKTISNVLVDCLDFCPAIEGCDDV